MKNKILFFTFFICSILKVQTVFAQTSQQFDSIECGTDMLRKKELLISPKLQAQSETFEAFYRDFVHSQSRQTIQSRGIVQYTIPVVFHIFHLGEPVGDFWNPTDAEIQVGLDLLNNNFKHLSNTTFSNNPFSGVNMQIEFCMAKRTPTNTPTTGVERYNQPTLASPSDFAGWYDRLSPYLWDVTKYCNILLIRDFPPGPPAIGAYSPGMDAILLRTYLMTGGSAVPTHEMGHYFSLEHPFLGSCPNDDCLVAGDRVCDTPPRFSPSSTNDCANIGNSCDTDDDDLSTNNPFRPIANGGLGDIVDSYENYMDYTGCGAAFTQGQKVRAIANIVANRMAIVSGNLACTAVLGAEIISFNAKNNNNEVEFLWHTANEFNVKNFEIEKSTDGKDFSTIAEVKAKNTPSVYQAFDDQFFQSAYYRLKINDLDGTFDYSKTIFVENNQPNKVKIYPSVTSGLLTIENAKSFEIVNAIGQVVEKQGIGILESIRYLTLNHLPNGFYLVKGLDTEGGVFSQKVIKQ
jgi:Pregnancy-associated plasma protein-A